MSKPAAPDHAPMRARRWFLAAVAVFLVSLVLPAFEGMPNTILDKAVFSGWQCALWYPYHIPSNLIILFSPILARIRRRWFQVFLAYASFGGIAASLAVVIEFWDGLFLPGYYLWILSQLFLCIGALRNAKQYRPLEGSSAGANQKRRA